MSLLKDAPGWPEFVDRITRSARMLALDFAGRPDEEVRPLLEAFLANIEAAMIDAIGAKRAPVTLNIFRRSIMAHKHQVEAAALSGSLAQFLDVLSR